MCNELTVTAAVHLLTVKDMSSLYLKSESGHPDKNLSLESESGHPDRILCCEK